MIVLQFISGTENSRLIYKRMLDFLKEHRVEIISECEVKGLTLDNFSNRIIYTKKGETTVLSFDKIVVAMGRAGNKLVKEICDDNAIEYKNGEVQVGCRIETTNDIMKKLNDNFYELKTYFISSFGDKCRTFCVNPSGFVSIESYPYDNNRKLFCANGHSFKNKKSNNTNFAILVSRSFNNDMIDPLENYVYPLTLAVNSLGNGSVIIQSLKDIKLQRRSTDERLKELSIVPTAKAYAGDLTSAMPYRTLQSILEFIEELDNLVPGINGDNTLLYGLEVKLCSNKVLIDKYGRSSNPNIYFIGDCSGYCPGWCKGNIFRFFGKECDRGKFYFPCANFYTRVCF